MEGHTYEITQRVYGKKVKTEIQPKDTDEPLPSPLETNTTAREGGIGFQMKVGSKIEIDAISVKILR